MAKKRRASCPPRLGAGLGQHANPIKESRIHLEGRGDADPLAILRGLDPATRAIRLAHATQFFAREPNRLDARDARIRLAHKGDSGVGSANNVSGQVQHGSSPIRGLGILPSLPLDNARIRRAMQEKRLLARQDSFAYKVRVGNEGNPNHGQGSHL